MSTKNSRYLDSGMFYPTFQPVIHVYFPSSFPEGLKLDYTDINSKDGITLASNEAKKGIVAALDMWSRYAQVEFIPMADSTYITTGNSLNISFIYNKHPGTAIYPMEPDPSLQAFRGDIFFTKEHSALSYFPSNGSLNSRMNFHAALHEIGHALGLSHTGGKAPLSEDSPAVTVPDNENDLLHSVMAYDGLLDLISGRYPITPMLYDIAKLQEVYGVKSFNGEANTKFEFTDTETPFIKYGINVRPDKALMTLLDTGGDGDVIDASTVTNNVKIDLREGEFSAIGTNYKPLAGDKDLYGNKEVSNPTFNVGIAFDTIIENAKSGKGDDWLVGNDVNNELDGGEGKDVLKGGSGADILIGGKDTDYLLGDQGIDTYTFSATWGNDVISDSDGLGKIVVDDITINGGKRTSANTYLSKDQLFSYQLNTDGSLVIHKKDSNSAISIRNWKQGAGKLGITLDDTLFDPINPDDRGVPIFKGDQHAPIDNNKDGLSYYDWTKTSWAADGSLVGGVAEANFADVIYSSGSAVLYGYGGNDALGGGIGVDDIFGGDGNDLIGGGAGADYINGGRGDDRIHSGGTVSAYGRYFVGETWGEERWRAYGRNPLVAGQTVVWAEATHGVYKDALGNNIIWGISLDATQADGDFVEGGEGNDLIFATDARDTLDGGNDNDSIYGLGGNDQLSGGSGADSLVGDGSYVEIDEFGYYHFDYVIPALHGSDVIDGGAGSDTILGGGGDDQLFGGDGSDSIHGDDTDSRLAPQFYGSDVLFGDGGNDYLYGDGGDDRLFGGDGDDRLDGGIGADYMEGGYGSNTYLVDNPGDVIIEFGSTDADTTLTQPGIALSVRRNIQKVEASITYTLGANLNNLTLLGLESINGSGNELDNVIVGNTGNNELSGGDGNDRLESGDGSDTLDGGEGNDSYVILASNGDKHIVDVGGFDDILLSWQASKLRVMLESGALALKDGVSGKQVFIANVDGNNLSKSVGVENFQLLNDSGAVINLTAAQILAMGVGQIGTASNDTLLGTDVNDYLLGMGGNDTLSGFAGDDVLDGGAGTDLLVGGLGNDTYVVEQGDDVVQELANEGIDTVQTLIDYTLSVNLENLTLLDGAALSGIGNDQANVITGNANANLLVGAGGSDVLDGRAGADRMIGGVGDDTYYVDNTDDVVVELENEGVDSIHSSVSLTLSNTVENLTLDGALAIDGTGNEFSNVLVGNSSVNHLVGGAGNDFLDGGAGEDLLIGGLGDDEYRVDSVNDVIQEALNEGVDSARASISFVLPTNVENLILDELGGGIDGIGNALRNRVIGNNFDNVLDGGDGVDTLIGSQGNDRYLVDEISDQAIELADEGYDTVESSVSYVLGDNIEVLNLVGSDNINATGNSSDNQIVGNNASNRLDGGGGNDGLIGGLGDDLYIVNSDQVQVIENWDEGVDTIERSFDSFYWLQSNVENLTLVGSAARGTGNELDNIITGNDADNTLMGMAGNDTLIGGAGKDNLFGSEGADTLIGGAGNDFYDVDDLGDTIVENAGDGDDFVRASISWTLTANLENISAGGAEDLALTGNTQDNALLGNTASNLLTGGLGNDYLQGGQGNDVYVFNRGDGQDFIDTTDILSATDTLRFGAGIAATDVVASQYTTSLFLRIKGSSDQIGFNNYFAANTTLDGQEADQKIDRIEFANGVVWDQQKIQSLLNRATTNRAPTVNTFLPTLQAKVDSPFTYVVAANTIIDPDVDDSITYSIKMQDGSAIPAWLSFDAATRTLSGTPAASNIGTLKFLLLGTDNYNSTTGEQVSIAVSAINRAPVIATALLDQTASQGVTFTYTIPTGAFTDPEGASLTYSATLADGSALPSWLTFNAGTRAFSGKPTTAGAISVKVTAKDTGSLAVSDIFDIAVSVQSQTLNGTANADTLNGGAGDDTLNGLAGNDTLNGGAGNDVLDGGTGSDVMKGGPGDDTYFMDVSTDALTENANEGNDTINAGFTYTLGVNLENLNLTGTANINGTGNALANTLKGNAGNNLLDGAAGNDVYLIAPGGGQDTIQEATADASAGKLNILRFATGINSSNTLVNRSGSDLVVTFMGSADKVTVKSFYVNGDSANTSNPIQRIEFAEGGVWDLATIDQKAHVFVNHAPTVATSIPNQIAAEDTAWSYTIPATTFSDADLNAGDTLTYTATQADGSVLPSWVSFNAATRTFSGTPANADVGNLNIKVTAKDAAALVVSSSFTLAVSNTNDAPTLVAALTNQNAISGKAFSFVVPANTFADVDAGDTLSYSANQSDGSALPSWLTFNAGTRTLSGMPASVGTLSLRVQASDSAGSQVSSSFALAVGANIINGTVNADTLTGTDFVDVIYGLEDSDMLDGGAGADTLIGGVGDDLYGVDNAQDVVVELAEQGLDTVQSSISWTLGANIENLKLTGVTALNGYGNTLNNRISGNSADNTIQGEEGEDVLLGQDGQDTLIGGAGKDWLYGGFGNDNLLGGAGNDFLKAGDGDDILHGDEGNDSLLGERGVDALYGGLGNDYLSGQDGNDRLFGEEGNDQLFGGTGDDSLSGGEGNDLFWGGDGADLLEGDAGADRFFGGAGDDRLFGGEGDDLLWGDGGDDELTGGAGSDTYRFGRDYGHDTVVENDTAVGVVDSVYFDPDITIEQLWFQQVGNNLEVDIIGTQDSLTLSDWYSGSQHHVEQFKTNDGSILLDSQVQALVQAMAAFAPPVAGQTSLTGEQAQALYPVIAVNWH